MCVCALSWHIQLNLASSAECEAVYPYMPAYERTWEDTVAHVDAVI